MWNVVKYLGARNGPTPPTHTCHPLSIYPSLLLHLLTCHFYFLALLHRILTNQEMMMDQLKVIQMNMQKMGEPAHGQDPIDKDLLPVKDLTSLLALEKRLREEADLKKNGN